MAKLISPDSIVSKKAVLEDPVRIYAFAGIQAGAKIGRYTIINRHAFVSGTTTLGRYCNISRSVEIGASNPPNNMLSTHPFQFSKSHFDSIPAYTKFKRKYKVDTQITTVGHDVSIGAKSILASGVTVGTGAVIGTACFVNFDVPPYAIVEETPARIVGTRFPEQTVEKLLASDWWTFTPEELKNVSFDQIDTAITQIALLHAAEPAKKVKPEAASDDLENDPIVQGLKQSLYEVDMPDNVIDLVMSSAPAIARLYDPLDTGDQEVLRNKLAYLIDFVAEHSAHDLSVNEEKHIANLFRQKV